MHVIAVHATSKAAAALGAPRLEVAPSRPKDSPFGDWLLNLVPLGDRYGYLFMNCRSLLSFPMLVGRQAPEVQDVPMFLVHGVTQLLRLMGLPGTAYQRVLGEVDAVALCKAGDKSMLGIMSAVAADYFHHIGSAGGVNSVLLDTVIVQVNTSPRRPLGWRCSFDVAGELLHAGAA